MKKKDHVEIANKIFDILTDFTKHEIKTKKVLLGIIDKYNNFKPNSTSKYLFYNNYILHNYYDEINQELTKKGKSLINR